MILVDTSVWIDHFRASMAGLIENLQAGVVVTHPFVIGELALGHLRKRTEILGLLANLPSLDINAQDAVLRFIDDQRLAGTGIGWVDAHLLFAAASGGASIFTRDTKLHKQAARLGLL